MRDLYWYDVEKKKMLRFKGDRLDFVYVLDNTLPKPKYRLLPKLVVSPSKEEIKLKIKQKPVLQVEISGKPIGEIQSWFKRYERKNPTDVEIDSINKKDITFNVPAEEAEDFVMEAVKNGFIFDA
jgi:hypothetical protein